MRLSGEIDLEAILLMLWRRIGLIIIAVVTFTCGAFLFTRYFIAPEYTANAVMFIDITKGGTNPTVLTYSDLTLSRSLVDTYTSVMQTRKIFDRVRNETGYMLSDAAFIEMMKTNAVNDTEVFNLSITHTNPETATRIANAFATVVLEELDEIISGSRLVIIDYAIMPGKPSSPNIVKYTFYGGIAGFAIIVSALILLELFNPRIKAEKDIKAITDLPLLGSVPRVDKRYEKMLRNYILRG